MATLGEIEAKCAALRKARDRLTLKVRNLEEDIQRLKRERLPGVKEALGVVVNAHNDLSAAVAESGALFTKPRTLVLHGIKVGFQKQKGRLSWDDDAQVVKLIRQHLPDQADVLIRVTEAPVRDALSELDGRMLKKLGVTVEADGDKVVVKPVDSEIDRLVNALVDTPLEADSRAAD